MHVIVLAGWAEVSGCAGLAAQLGVLVVVVESEGSAAKHVHVCECGWLTKPALAPEFLDVGLSKVGMDHGEHCVVLPLSNSIELRHM